MTKAQIAEREAARADLLRWLKPGDTVYTVLDHVSSSGMSRAIRVIVPTVRWVCIECHGQHDSTYAPRICSDTASGCQGQTFRAAADHLHPNWAVGRLLGLRHWRRNGREQDALVVGGCGMDMGFHLVYELSSALFGNGYACLGKVQCPASYHANFRRTADGDPESFNLVHTDGYALRHRWL